jgi:hypothetical protein
MLLGSWVRLHRMQKKADRSLVVEYAVIIIGVLLVALGILYQVASQAPHTEGPVADVIAGLLLAIGGGILGAGLNSLIVRKYEFDVLEEIGSLLKSSLEPSFKSPDADLEPYRKEWHHYYLSENNGEPVWFYVKHDFGGDGEIGSISRTIVVHDSGGREHRYFLEAAVREGDYFLSQRARTAPSRQL